MANNFIKFKGSKIGKSLNEKGTEAVIGDIYDQATRNNCKILIPSDCAVSESMDGEAKFKGLGEIMDDEMILDIGPKTIDEISKVIDISKTVMWNGPAGYFENQNFSNGTVSIAKKSRKIQINHL